MIDLIQQGHDCPCAECRAKRYASTRCHEKRIPKTAFRKRALPVRYARATQAACPTKLSSCRKPASGFGMPTKETSQAVSTVGFPAWVAVNVYPIEKSPHVQVAMQYFLEMFTMSIHPHVDVPDGWRPKAFWAEKMSSAIADPMWFNGTVAFAECMKQKTICGTNRKSDLVMKHSAGAIAGLRDRIASGKSRLDDLAILTITSLMSIEVVTRDLKSWKAHIDGLERIVALRGGLDSLNSNLYVKHKVIGFQLFWLYKQMSLGTAPHFAIYPEHPFPPGLCRPISKMPNELSELALEGCLNVNLINLMAPLLALSSKFVVEKQKEREDLRRLKCLAYDLEEVLCITDLTQLEVILTLALIDYSITLDTDRGLHWLLVGSCQIHCSRVVFTGIEHNTKRHDFLVWVGAVFVACGEMTLQTAILGQKILARCGIEKRIDRNSVLATCQKFAWDDVLTQKLDMRFDFDAASSVGSRSETLSPEPEQPITCNFVDMSQTVTQMGLPYNDTISETTNMAGIQDTASTKAIGSSSASPEPPREYEVKPTSGNG